MSFKKDHLNDFEKYTFLITGASSGVGRSLTIKLASLGGKCIITARRIEILEKIRENFPNNIIKAIEADLSAKEGIQNLLMQIEPYKDKITHVINNAGSGYFGLYKNMDAEIIYSMINLNIVTPSIITNYFVKNFYNGFINENINNIAEIKADNEVSASGVKNRYSERLLHIINIGSVAGVLPNQGIAIYSATKSYIDTFTKSLQAEKRKKDKIYFTLILPGAIKTEFFDRAEKNKGAQKIGLPLFEMKAEKVVNKIIKSIKKRDKIVYIPSILSVLPFLNLLFGRFARNLGPILFKEE